MKNKQKEFIESLITCRSCIRLGVESQRTWTPTHSNQKIQEMRYHKNEKTCKIERRVDPSLTIGGLGCQRWILKWRDRGSRCRGEERPGRAQSVVFVLEFLRFTDVRSGKAFEIWNECAQTFIPQEEPWPGEDAWFCAHEGESACSCARVTSNRD